jgi:hypothetical protein
MLHAQNLFYIHRLYTQKGVYSIFEYRTNFEGEAFRFSMKITFWTPKLQTSIKHVGDIFDRRDPKKPTLN